MKRCLREPWLIIGAIGLVLSLLLSLFEMQISAPLGNEGWWVIETVGNRWKFAGGEGFGWVFGFGSISHFVGFEKWTWAEFFAIPSVEIEPGNFELAFSPWPFVIVCLSIGAFSIWIRFRKARHENSGESL